MAQRGKMKKRRSGTQFKKKHPLLPARRHAAQDDFQPGPSSASQEEPHQPAEEQRTHNLRPRGNLQKTEDTENKHEGNRIVDLQCLLTTMNSVLQDHQKFPTYCENIDLVISSERKVGLGSDLRFTCKSCQFVSGTCQTYKPREGKSKGAAINMLLATGLLGTKIGVEQINILLATMNINPPSRSHLQDLVTEASEITNSLNKRDMSEKREQVIDHNRAQGAADPHQMDVSFDVRYNANRMTSSYKPSQSGSQAYGLAIENHTTNKYIVGLATENKLSQIGANLRTKGHDVTCPGEQADCTANRAYFNPHSEKDMAKDIASDLHQEGIVIPNMTTDGDTKSSQGVQDLCDAIGEDWEVTRQADPNHLGSSQIRRVRKANWSAAMFPGKRTRHPKQQAITAFSRDVKARCTMIIEKLRTLGDGDITKEIKRLPEVCKATIQCYAGNCSFCPHQSLVCNGVGGLGDWWFHSQFLPTHNISNLKMTESDKKQLQTILEVRLSEKAVYSVSSNTSTQKNEAFNRGSLSNLPKETNFSRTFDGRLATKTLQSNNGIKSAVEARVAETTGQKLSLPAQRYLDGCRKREDKRKSLQKSPEFKANRRITRAKLENSYHQKMSGEVRENEYVKGQLDGL